MPGTQPVYMKRRVALGAELGRARAGAGLWRRQCRVDGHGRPRGARAAAVAVVGVIPELLTTKELMGEKIGELIVVDTHARAQSDHGLHGRRLYRHARRLWHPG